MNNVIRLLYPFVVFGGIFFLHPFPSNYLRQAVDRLIGEPANPVTNADNVSMFNRGLLVRYTAANGYYSFIFEFKDMGDYKVRFIAPKYKSLTRSRYLPGDFDKKIDPHSPGVHIVGEILPRHVRLQVTHNGAVEMYDFYNDQSPLSY